MKKSTTKFTSQPSTTETSSYPKPNLAKGGSPSKVNLGARAVSSGNNPAGQDKPKTIKEFSAGQSYLKGTFNSMNRAQLILEGEPNTALRGGSSGTVAQTVQSDAPNGINAPNIFIPP